MLVWFHGRNRTNPPAIERGLRHLVDQHFERFPSTSASDPRAIKASALIQPEPSTWSQKEVPGPWYVTEMTDALTHNPAYYGAILRSIKTFGIYIGKEV